MGSMNMKFVRAFVILMFLAGIACSLVPTSVAQGIAGVDPYANREIENVIVRIANPSTDTALNERVGDRVRTLVGLFPGERFSEERLAFQLSQVRRTPDIAALDYEISFGSRGGLSIEIEIVLGAVPEGGRGLALGGDFPTIYDKDGTLLSFRLDVLGLYYGNNNAWYGRPSPMLAGNPLVSGEPAGEGYDDWVESFAHYGVYGITPINANNYIYSSLSAITAASSGQELFTDETRINTSIEDAYLGLVGGKTDPEGNRLTYNLSLGRQRFTLANGFLVANTAANGQERAALQANARWAADMLVLAQLRYNETKLEFFHLDPDELPVIDSKTTYTGVNLETQATTGLDLGFSYLTSLASNFSYFSPAGGSAGTREGLQVYDARFKYSPNTPGQAGPFFGAEYAVQRNRNFDMEARAGWVEAGYSLPRLRWSPTVSYRLSMFSGDDPTTATYERWDPLLSGGNGEQWVQGANHFKVVQNSNIIAHRLQARVRPGRMVEIVPQIWVFRADQKNNIGGNPALSFLNDKEYGFEANVTAKWFVSRNTYVHGHLAYTIPGDAARAALNEDTDNWLSAMAFIRYAF